LQKINKKTEVSAHLSMATVGRAATVEGLDGEASGRRPQPGRRRLRAGLLVAAGLARGGDRSPGGGG